MIRNVIVICISTLGFCLHLAAQNLDLLLFEERWFNASNEQDRNAILLEKLVFQLMHPELINTIHNTMDRLNDELLSDSVDRADFLWNSALFCLIDEREQEGMSYLNKYKIFTNDSIGKYQLLKVLLRFPYNPEEAKMMYNNLLIQDPSYAGMECYFDVSIYSGKSLNYYILASAIVPGSGIIALGKPLKGLTSMGLNAGSVTLALLLWREQLFINSIFWGGLLFSKFYSGQIILTGTVFAERVGRKKEKLAKECELLCGGLLSSLAFRGLTP